jgi:ornithine cyclodeaminase
MTKVRVLSGTDVRALVEVDEAIAAMRETLANLSAGRYHQPLRWPIRTAEATSFLGLMPAHMSAGIGWGVKATCVVPDNPRRGLDSHQGAVLLFDETTGATRAIIEAGSVTAARTAAASAVATDVLARPDSAVLALIGAGIQARAHIEALRAVRPLHRVIVTSRSSASAERLAADIDGGEVVGSAAEAVADADVVVVATTSSTPVLEWDWLARGTHVNALGAASFAAQEIATDVVRNGEYFVDSRESAHHEAAELRAISEDPAEQERYIAAELGEVINGTHPGRTGSEAVTVFRSLGLAVEDIALCDLAVRRAEERGRGSVIDLGP